MDSSSRWAVAAVAIASATINITFSGALVFMALLLWMHHLIISSPVSLRAAMVGEVPFSWVREFFSRLRFLAHPPEVFFTRLDIVMV